MEDQLFDEVLGPLLGAAYRRASERLAPGDAADAVQDAAVAAWRALPKLASGADAAAWFDRLLQRELASRPRLPSPPAQAPEGFAAEVLDVARSHSRRPGLQVHAPLAGATALVLLLAAAGAVHVAAGAAPQPAPAQARLGYPEKDFGPVPGGGPLAWAIDGRHSNWLIAFDSEGHPVGTLRLPEAISTVGGVPAFGPGSTVTASPDGSVIWTGDRFVNPAGRTLGRLGATTGLFVWSDRSDEVCGITYAGPGEWTLWTYVFGEAVTTVVRGSGPAPDLIRCSYWQDRLLLAERSGTPGANWVTDLRVYRVSDGSLLKTLVEPPGAAVVSVTATPDVLLVAENSAAGSRVRRISDGAVLFARPGAEVLAFSDDSGLVLTGTAAGPGPALDLTTGSQRIAALPQMAGSRDSLVWPFGYQGFMYWRPDTPGFILASTAGGFQADYGRVTAVPEGAGVFIAPPRAPLDPP